MHAPSCTVVFSCTIDEILRQQGVYYVLLCLHSLSKIPNIIFRITPYLKHVAEFRPTWFCLRRNKTVWLIDTEKAPPVDWVVRDGILLLIEENLINNLFAFPVWHGRRLRIDSYPCPTMAGLFITVLDGNVGWREGWTWFGGFVTKKAGKTRQTLMFCWSAAGIEGGVVGKVVVVVGGGACCAYCCKYLIHSPPSFCFTTPTPHLPPPNSHPTRFSAASTHMLFLSLIFFSDYPHLPHFYHHHTPLSHIKSRFPFKKNIWIVA